MKYKLLIVFLTVTFCFANIKQTTHTPTGLINTHDADYHTSAVIEHFLNYTGVTTNLSSVASVGDITINVTDASGFATTNMIVIDNTTKGEQDHLHIRSIVGNAIGIMRPLDNSYTDTANTTIEIVNMDMITANGTIDSPVIYTVKPTDGEVWHIVRILAIITHGSAGDLSKIGDQAALTNGIIIREKKSDGTYQSLGQNIRSNGDMKLKGYDLDFTDKAGGGNHGTTWRFTLARVGAIVKLDGSLGEELQILLPDSTVGNITMEIVAEGHKEGS